ncbi:MAG: O-antigen ligase [Saprospiraceae bacterium]|jgi:O-antigen ligase
MTKKANKKTINPIGKIDEERKKINHTSLNIYWIIAVLVFMSVAHTYTTSEPAPAIRTIILSILSLGFLCYHFLFKKKIIYLNTSSAKWFLILWVGGWLWSIVVSLQAINVPEAFLAIGQELAANALLIAAVWIFQKENNYYRIILKALTLLGLFHSLAGILQYTGIGFNEANIQFPYGFTFNRTLYGSFLAILLPFSIGQLFSGSFRWRIIAAIALGAEIVAIIIAQCRSAWVAVAMIILAANILVFINKKHFSKIHLRRWWGLNFGSISLLVFSFFLVSQLNIGGPVIQSTVERVSSIIGNRGGFSASSSTINERLMLWEQSLFMIKDHPILGVGAGNWKLAAAPYLKDIPSIAYGDYFLIRPHNSWLQIGVERGIPGLLAYMLAWGMLFIMAFRIIKRAKGFSETIFYMALFGALLAFAVDQVFSFPHERIGHLSYLAAIAGMVIGTYDRILATSKRALQIPRWTFAVLALLLILNTVNALGDLRFQQIWKKTFEAAGSNNFSEAIALAEKGKKYWQNLGPNTDPIEILTSLVYQNQKQYDKALEEIKLAEKYQPNSYRVYNAMGTIYTEMGRYAEAEEVYLKGLELTPKYRTLLKNLALNYFQDKKYRECIKVIEQMNIRGDEQLTYMLNESRLLTGK